MSCPSCRSAHHRTSIVALGVNVVLQSLVREEREKKAAKKAAGAAAGSSSTAPGGSGARSGGPAPASPAASGGAGAGARPSSAKPAAPPSPVDPSSASASDSLREKGNAAFKSASVAGLGTTLVYARLQSALRFYEDALRAASTAGESAAACKNSGVTRAKMLLLRPPAMEEVSGFSGEAGRTLRAFADARAAGAAAGKPSAWLSDVAEAATGFVFDVTDRAPGWFGKLLPPLPARRSMQSLCAALADAVMPGLAARVAPAAAHGGAGVGAGAGGASARGPARSGGAATGGAGAGGGGGGAAARPIDVKLAIAVARACVAEGEAVLAQVTLTDAAGAPRKKRDRSSRTARGKAGAGAAGGGGGDESGDESEDEGAAGGAGAAPRPSGPARKVAQASRAGDQDAIRKGIPLLQEAEPLAELAVALAKAAKDAAPADTAAASAASDALADAQDLSRVLFVHGAILASTQARLRGEELLEAAVSEDATGKLTVDNLEGLFEAADRYRAAAVAAREADVESEALALASLGRLYRDALRGDAMPDADERALALFKRAIALGLSCAPRTFLGVPWYDEAVDFVNKYVPTPPPGPDVPPIILEEEMREECAAVDAAAAKGAAALLTHIYSKHPPRHVSGKEMAMGSTKADDMKKTVLQAITHYHPDKQEHAPAGAGAAAVRKVAVWRAFSSFIVKHLNHFYDMLKT